MTTRIDALVAKLRRALAVNSTDGTFATVLTDSVPPADAFDLAAPGVSVGHGAIVLQPFATGGDNVTFSIRIIGFRQVGNDPNTQLYVQEELYEADCITGADHGKAGRIVLDTEFFADTITLVFGNANVSVETLSPANDNNGHICVDTKGCRYVKPYFKMGTATDANALIAPF